MQPTILKFATWNIGGGILGESHQRGGRPSLDYYAQVLAERSPDVVCLQEAHSFPDKSREGQSEYLARKAGYKHVIALPVSESHLAEDAYLTLGILSRYPILRHVYTQFPNPGLTSIGPDGNRWVLLDKGYIKASIALEDQPLGVLNAHCYPLHYFKAKPTEERFRAMWRMLADDLLDMRDGVQTIACMDLNYAPVQDLLPELLQAGRYASAFGNTPTTTKGVQQDYILYDQRMGLSSATVTPTESDHSYCEVEVAVIAAEAAGQLTPSPLNMNAQSTFRTLAQ